jgi:hypothetical protein
MVKHCKTTHDDQDAEVEGAEKSEISIQRFISNIVTALFTLFPKIGKKLTKQQASQILNAMCSSGMLKKDPWEGVNTNNADGRRSYAEHMIRYELDIRSIARHYNIRQSAAVLFMKCCFKANRIVEIYPYNNCAEMVWPSYSLLSIKFGDTIAQYIIETMIDGTSIKELSSRFPLFARVSKSVAHTSPAMYFILEGCNYVANHDDHKKECAVGQSERIFIDEFVDYLREMDEDKYLQMQDEIARLLCDIDDSFTPDCTRVVEHLDLSRFGDDVAHIRSGFEQILVKQQKPKPIEVPPEDVEAADDEPRESPRLVPPAQPPSTFPPLPDGTTFTSLPLPILSLPTLSLPVEPMPAAPEEKSKPKSDRQKPKWSAIIGTADNAEDDGDEDDEFAAEREDDYGAESGDEK